MQGIGGEVDRSESVEPILLRVERAAELTGISRAKAYALVASGEWPSVTIGRCRRVPLEGLRSWAQRQAARVSVLNDGRSG